MKTRKRKEHPVITKFKHMLLTNPIEYQYMNTMISSSPNKITLNKLFQQINDTLTKAPEFNTPLAGTPLSAILVLTMGSTEGFAAYRREKINDMFREVLLQYKTFLDSPASRYVLNESNSGWFGKEASKKINMNEFQCEPTKPYYGFSSWNDFFTRKLKPGARPIVEPTNNRLIHAACDSTLYRIHHGIKSEDTFWIKSQPYSLREMLGDTKYVQLFKGGTIYQAFLNPFHYHRWHSPVNGTIEKAYVKQGLYFTQVNEMGQDPSAQEKSLGYITHVNTRALIYIKTVFGTICAMFVGMVEISSCTIHKKIKPGYTVKKGEELGFFAYGGSTYCLLFENHITFTPRKEVKMGEVIAELV